MKEKFDGQFYSKRLGDFYYLEDDSFFVEYFDQGKDKPYYNVHPNGGSVHDKKTALSEDNAVYSVLDHLATCILYVIWKDKEDEAV